MKEEGISRGNVYGSYVHGIFDREGIAKGIVDALRKEKGILEGKEAAVDYRAYRERQYDKLAEGLRESLDMELVYRVIKEGV